MSRGKNLFAVLVTNKLLYCFCREKLEAIVKQHFLPLYPILVEDEDPIPMYAQKLLVMLLDLRCIQIGDILQLKLISQFFEFLQSDLPSINLHNVRLCLYLASSPDVESKVLSDLQVVGPGGDTLRLCACKRNAGLSRSGSFCVPIFSRAECG